MKFESVADVAAVHIQFADGPAVLAISPCNVDSVHSHFLCFELFLLLNISIFLNNFQRTEGRTMLA